MGYAPVLKWLKWLTVQSFNMATYGNGKSPIEFDGYTGYVPISS
jgi:hypothetical protein